MKAKTSQKIGWGLSLLVAAFLIFGSAIGKFVEWEGKAEMFSHLGYTSELLAKIGVVEVAVAILFVIPRTDFLGALLLTAYLGGATATHVRVGDPFFFPIILGVVVWVAFALRRPVVWSLATGSSPTEVADAKP